MGLGEKEEWKIGVEEVKDQWSGSHKKELDGGKKKVEVGTAFFQRRNWGKPLDTTLLFKFSFYAVQL